MEYIVIAAVIFVVVSLLAFSGGFLLAWRFIEGERRSFDNIVNGYKEIIRDFGVALIEQDRDDVTERDELLQEVAQTAVWLIERPGSNYTTRLRDWLAKLRKAGVEVSNTVPQKKADALTDG